MSDVFFDDLQLPEPEHNLGVGSGTHAEQTGRVMIAYEKICLESPPDCIIVVGDVNSTAACAIVGKKLWLPVVHLEAGLRSNDRTMPEEINRLLTDAIADLLWTPSADADENLSNEGIAAKRIDRIGNIMIDSFEMLRDKIYADDTRSDLGLTSGQYALVTLHRPSNVDSSEMLTEIINTLSDISTDLPVVFVAHPRTVKGLERDGLRINIDANEQFMLVEPLPYIKFMNLVTSAKVVITDSGGLQEETTYLNIPCLTLRPNTERPVTVDLGTNELVTASSLEASLRRVIDGGWKQSQRPELWDGNTASRAVESLARFTRSVR